MSSNPVLNPAYSLQKSNISLGAAEQPRLYTTSIVGQHPAYSKHINTINSSYLSPPINASFNPTYTTGNYLLPPNQSSFVATQGLKQVPIEKTAYVTSTEKRQTKTWFTYHPYTKTYIDYEQQTVLVPVQRVKIKYYQKIFETQYVPQAIQQIVTETIPVEKQGFAVRYVPVEQKIIHFPTGEKRAEESKKQQRRVIYVDSPREGEQMMIQRNQALKEREASALASQNNNISTVIQQQTVITPPQPLVVKVVRNSSQREATLTNSVKNETANRVQEQQWKEPSMIIIPPSEPAKKSLRQSEVKEVYKSNFQIDQPQFV